MIEDENQRQTNENTRQGNEVIREASMEEFLRAFPFPITQAEYDNLRAENSAYRVYIYTVTVDDGLETEHLEIRQDVTNDPTSIEGTIKYVFAFDSDSVYAITDDAEIQRMLAVVSEADELLSKQMYVTAEQYAEYSANDWAVFHQLYPNLNPAEVNFYIEDNELYDTLVEAGEQEPIRQEHEVERQAALEAMLRSHPNPITTAEYDHLHDDGYYCNWYYASNEWTMSVDSSSDPTADYSFPYQSDVVYQVTDESAESDLKAWVELNFVNKQTQDTGVTFEITADTDYQVNDVYASYAHQGERISFVISADVVKLAGAVSQTVLLGEFKGLPTLVMNGLYPVTIGGLPYLDNRRIDAFSGGFSSVEIPCNATKDAGNNGVAVYSDMTNLVEGTHYHVRYEVTFLLTPNLYGGN